MMVYARQYVVQVVLVRCTEVTDKNLRRSTLFWQAGSVRLSLSFVAQPTAGSIDTKPAHHHVIREGPSERAQPSIINGMMQRNPRCCWPSPQRLSLCLAQGSAETPKQQALRPLTLPLLPLPGPNRHSLDMFPSAPWTPCRQAARSESSMRLAVMPRAGSRLWIGL